MGWPKGVPRKGYVKKDGTPHATKVPAVAVSRKAVATRPQPILSRADEVATDMSGMSNSSAYEGPIHGMKGDAPITEVCPNCGYAYADGGWCPDCGWTKFTRIDPHGTHQGRRF